MAVLIGTAARSIEQELSLGIPAPRTTRGAAPPNRRRDSPTPAKKPKGPPWGVLELASVSSTVFPAMLYIPGFTALRTPLRVLDYTLVLMIWAWVLVRGGREVGRPFPARIWLAGCAVWLLLSIFHPTTNSLISGTAEAVLVISIMSPVFWVPALKIPPERLKRIIRLIFLASLASALWGLGQVYMPERFNPPDVKRFHDENNGEALQRDLKLTLASGQEIIRPCGLTDNPGGAAAAAVNVLLIGLVWALRPMALWRRGVLVGLGFMSMGIMYLSQVRTALISSVGGLAVTAGLFALRRNFGRSLALAVILAALAAGSLAWAIRVGGEEAIERFAALLDQGTSAYQDNRGVFINRTLTVLIPRYPLGAGLGRWGQSYYYFGNKSDPFGVGRGELYSELQLTAWVYDGGVPLTLAYITAICVAMWHVCRIALRGHDPEVSYWACAVFAIGLTLMAAAMVIMPFIGPTGVQFWLLVTTLYTADEQARIANRKARTAALRGKAT
jgi:hypothetical protein